MKTRLGAILLLCPGAAFAQGAFGPRPGTPEAQPVTGLVAWLLKKQAEFHAALTKAISAVASDPSALYALVAFAFVYGLLHAVGPGHGKAVVTAYLVSSERAARRGIALAFAASGVQALVAFSLVGIMFYLLHGTAAQMKSAAETIGIVGYALITLMGLFVVVRKARAFLGVAPADCGPDCAHQPLVSENTSLGQMALTAIGAGFRPCTGAVILLVFALTKGLYLAGALSVTAMSVGTAIGTSAFALLALKAKSLSLSLVAGRSRWFMRITLGVELLAGIALVVIGGALFWGTLTTLL